jgi:anti-sigma factor RsiW
MKCKECIEFLNDYLDGSLPQPQREVFETHLQRCPPCMVYLETYRKTIAASKAAIKACDCEVPDALIKAILDARKK